MPEFSSFWQWLGWMTFATIPPILLMMAADVIFNISNWKGKPDAQEPTTR